MKVAVVGAGFTGLSAAYRLLKKGHEVAIFERDGFAGGLAVGFKEDRWKWSMEKHYHHWFTNDESILHLAKEIDYKVVTKRPKTSVYIKDKIYQLDSPFNVLKFPLLSIFERLRLGAVLAFFKYNPFWLPLEKFNATKTLPKLMGKNVYETVWEPLFINKFGDYKDGISLAWFWARIAKRTPSLAYPKGGFLEFANALVSEIEKDGGKFYFNTEVTEIKGSENKVSLKSRKNGKMSNGKYDKVVVTLPSFFFTKILKGLPQKYINSLNQLKGLGAINLVLRLKKPFLKDGTYWLNICEKNAPVMSIVEHTNFMDESFYNNEHLVYLGNYLPYDHSYMKMDGKELLKIYDPLLTKINPIYHLSLITYHLFKVPFAQPIIPVNYSKILPSFNTPVKNVYLANIQQVYPWDRGTNYATQLGEKVAELID